jgi:hypothetical protein
MTIRRFLVLLLAGMLIGPIARAAPPGAPDRATREQVLKKIHTSFILELGEMLELDTPATIKLSERLQPYDSRRIQLRMDTWDAMEQLKKISKGKAEGDPVELARKIAKNRMQLAQVDSEELEELIKGLPPDKVAKAALFLAQYPRRIERMARDILQERMRDNPGEGPGAPPGPGPGGPPKWDE